MTEWKMCHINEIATLSNGINFDKSAYSKGVKLIGVSDFKDRIYPDYDTLQEVKAAVVRHGDYLKKGDIVFVRSNGNKELVGRCMMINQDIPTTFSGFCIRLHIDDQTIVNPSFLTYLCKSNDFRKKMSGTAVGANIQNLSQERLGNCTISIPDLTTQQRIAETLARYDALIENYQKQIKLLEDAAQRLYKEWFIDFRFPGHETASFVDGLPEGWEKKKIGNVVDTTSGGTPSRTKKDFYNGNHLWVKTKELNDGFIFDTEERITDEAIRQSAAKIIPPDSILLAMYGATIGKLGISTQELTCNQACCVMSFNDNSYLRWFLFIWLKMNRNFLISQGKGAAQPNLSQEMIKGFEVVIPTHKLLLEFDNHISKLFLSIKKYQLQQRLLTEARDRLLPKLMNSEIAI